MAWDLDVILALDDVMTRNELLQIEDACSDLFKESFHSFHARAGYTLFCFLCQEKKATKSVYN
jgi:hypothetical protein